TKLYWRKYNFIGDFTPFIGENSVLLAICPYLLAIIKLYWRTGNFLRFFPVPKTIHLKIKNPSASAKG
ncbi:hypothetical protein, partial [Escherichia coli]|uniref:hypothetical protein n=1 Tax=Escherichia coli TaxID=562 RepID=UPI003D336314